MNTTAPRSNATISKMENVRAAPTLARDTRNTEWLTVEEIASRLRVSKMTVYRHIGDGLFPGAIRAGRSIRVPVDGFEAYVRASEVGR